MNSLYKTLTCLSVSVTLASCGGSGSNTQDRQTLGVSNTVENSSLAANDGSSGDGAESLLLEGEPLQAAALRANDLGIDNVVVNSTNSGLGYSFDVMDYAGAEISLSSLSVALEVATSAGFADSFRVSLYDIRRAEDTQTDGTQRLTARSPAAELPAGSYNARLVVNPNWQYSFETIPAGHSDTQAYRYIDEINYRNNASGIFQLSIDSEVVCQEDGFEDNDSVSAATALPVGGQIEASLCLDEVDFYSVVLAEDESTSLTFDYTDAATNPNPATRYVVLDSNFNRITEVTVAREANRIVISASNAGQYYLALFGKRSRYRITRADGPGLSSDATNDSIFHKQSINGPQSWLYGAVTLNRLAFTESILRDQVLNCGRITTQFRDGNPVAYVTPDHFADIHEFRFLSDGGYLVDDEHHTGWHVQDGDISHANWYHNGYPGYAERVSSNEWRYWSEDGLAYVECTLALNR